LLVRPVKKSRKNAPVQVELATAPPKEKQPEKQTEYDEIVTK
jgi:hypothetical protein